jgi:GT2 family glycosyltransferase
VSSAEPGVTVLIPVLNGEPWLARTVAALLAQAGTRPFEVLVVDDGSADGSRAEAERLRRQDPRVRIVGGEGRGAAAALNLGTREARHEIVCQVDQDVEVSDGWLAALLAALEPPEVGAAQGVYVPDPHGRPLARVMGLDLAQRYEAIDGETDHVCTGNTAFRRRALLDAGLFDESLGYGYDNDMSYRLVAAGYRLVICPEARSLHHWRATIRGYLSQQYGFGYGRLDVVARHPRRVAGDAVSPARMMAHPIVFGGATALALVATVLWAAGREWMLPAAAAALLVAGLLAERGWAGVGAARRYADRAALLFPIVHLARDAAWLTAIAAWLVRRLWRRGGAPSHSMWPR